MSDNAKDAKETYAEMKVRLERLSVGFVMLVIVFGMIFTAIIIDNKNQRSDTSDKMTNMTTELKYSFNRITYLEFQLELAKTNALTHQKEISDLKTQKSDLELNLKDAREDLKKMSTRIDIALAMAKTGRYDLMEMLTNGIMPDIPPKKDEKTCELGKTCVFHVNGITTG